MSKNTARERMDDMLMEITNIHCLNFVAPPECKGADAQRYSSSSDTLPGIYLRREGNNASPTARPSNEEVKLNIGQARVIAGAIDSVSRPQRYGQGSFGRGPGEIEYPGTYAEFVDAWWDALGRRLGRAITTTEERAINLRVTRAAITGVE